MADNVHLEEARRAHDRARDFELSTNEAAINSGQLAIRTAVLINGGAAVAVLAFLGGLAGQGIISVRDLGKDCEQSAVVRRRRVSWGPSSGLGVFHELLSHEGVDVADA